MEHSKTQRQKTLGLTSPISLDGPTQLDLQRTQELEDLLKSRGSIETEEDLLKRMEVLGKVDILVKQWIKDVSIENHMLPDVVENVGGKVYAFGSYRLGIHTNGSDIDALCVAPRHVDRKEFFTSFYELLKQQHEVTKLRAVEDAFVPVMKMNFSGIELDIVFARTALKEIPENLDLSNDALIKNLDERCVRSLNGCRVTDEILRQVPNVNNFRVTLRTIKLWAKGRGLYSNALGYLGGVSWALLVARICQLYPNAVAATLTSKFFLIFSMWQWPLPLLLKKAEVNKLNYPVWDPRINVADRYHLMPIITPAYPEQNSTYNVSYSTRSIIVDEIQQGLVTVTDIMSGKCQWSRLFDSSNFFGRYKHFIVLTASADTEDHHLQCCGLMESTIRWLVKSLEGNNSITLAHINPDSYPALYPAPGFHVSMWFIGLTFEKVGNVNVDLTQEVQNFVSAVYGKTGHDVELRNGINVEARHIRRKELSMYLPQNAVVPQKRNGSLGCKSATSAEKDNRAPGSSKRKNDSDVGSAKKRFCIDKAEFVNYSPNTNRNSG